MIIIIMILLLLLIIMIVIRIPNSPEEHAPGLRGRRDHLVRGPGPRLRQRYTMLYHGRYCILSISLSIYIYTHRERERERSGVIYYILFAIYYALLITYYMLYNIWHIDVVYIYIYRYIISYYTILGNPMVTANLQPGEVVVDLGSDLSVNISLCISISITIIAVLVC